MAGSLLLRCLGKLPGCLLCQPSQLQSWRPPYETSGPLCCKPAPTVHTGASSSWQLHPSRHQTPLHDSHQGGFSFSLQPFLYPGAKRRGINLKRNKQTQTKRTALDERLQVVLGEGSSHVLSCDSRHPDTCSSSPLQMTEGRRCQVHLLDDRKLELLVQVGTAHFII